MNKKSKSWEGNPLQAERVISSRNKIHIIIHKKLIH